MIADNMDAADAGGNPFADGVVDIDAVASDRGGRHHDVGVVIPLGLILALELLDGGIFQGLVIGAPRRDARVAKAGEDLLLLELVRTGDVHLIDGRTLLHHHDQIVSLRVDAYIVEQAQAVEGTDGCSPLVVIVLFADLDRKRGKHGSGVHLLQALHLDVLDHEGGDCPGCIHPEGHTDDTGNRRAAEWGLETTFHKSQRNGRLHSTSESGSQHARDVVEQGDQHQTTKKRHSHPLEPLHPGG